MKGSGLGSRGVTGIFLLYFLKWFRKINRDNSGLTRHELSRIISILRIEFEYRSNLSLLSQWLVVFKFCGVLVF